MKNTNLIYLLLSILLVACNKDDSPVTPVVEPTSKSSAKQITGFAFRVADNEAFETDVIATIDQNGKTVTANVPHGPDVTALVPEIAVSEKAVVSPVGTANFTAPVSYTVTAEDGSTATYKATLVMAASSEKEILSFRFEGIESEGVTVSISADIDKENKTITATMLPGTDLTALEPSVEVSPGAILEPEGPQDFTEPIHYTVTAQNGSSATFLVKLKVALTEKEILLLIAKENPGNTLTSWTKENSLEDFEGVTIDTDGKVIGLVLENKRTFGIAPEIGQLVNLTLLNLLDNGLTSIPSEIGQLASLAQLNLAVNDLTSVPPEIGQLVNLTRLNLSSNDLAAIRPEIGQLGKLEDLFLGDNMLTAIPPEIGQLVNLTGLGLSSNDLATIPPEIGQLGNLEVLSLNGNMLTAIPPEIGQLVDLTYLDLHDNLLEAFPPEIGQLVNLTKLYLYNNLLKTIPPEFGQLTNLSHLYIYTNQLASVPPELGLLTQLKVLFLKGNGLTSIPNEVCNLDISKGGNTNVDIFPGVLCEFILGPPPNIPGSKGNDKKFKNKNYENNKPYLPGAVNSSGGLQQRRGNDPQKSSAKQIIGFVFRAADNATIATDVVAILDENAKTIGATVPDGTDITALVPTIEVSQKATVGPTGSKDFTVPVTYTVTAEDGSTTDYRATVMVMNGNANGPPGVFSLLQIANDSVDVVPAPTFSWEVATDPDGDHVTYDLYLDRQADPASLVAEGLSGTVFTLPDVMALSLARDYFWKVVAKDGRGGETVSETFTFKVQNLNDAVQLAQTTSFAPRSNHASVVFGSRMWILGGLDQGNDLNDAWSSADGAEWSFVNELSTEKYEARFFHDAVVFDDKMWVVGGLVGGSFSNNVSFSSNGEEWFGQDQAEGQLFEPRSEHTVTDHDGTLWVIAGGSGNGLLADVWLSESRGTNWERIIEQAPFGPRKFHQTVSFKDKLYVIAGQDDNGDKNDVWSSADGITWVEETPNGQFSPRGFHKALVFDEKISVVGGGALNDIWYSEDGVEWIDATPDVSFPVQGSFTALFYQNKIWILGGTPEVWTIDYHFFTN